MANWGEFIAEIPIINKRSEGIFVKVDHVIDLWEERNRLRAELANLKSGTGEAPREVAPPESTSEEADAMPALELGEEDQGRDSAQRERESCAQELEAFAQTYSEDPEQHEWAIQLLFAAAARLREKNDSDAADFLANVEIPPQHEPARSTEPPLAQPISEDEPPLAEPIPDAGERA